MLVNSTSKSQIYSIPPKEEESMIACRVSHKNKPSCTQNLCSICYSPFKNIAACFRKAPRPMSVSKKTATNSLIVLLRSRLFQKNRETFPIIPLDERTRSHPSNSSLSATSQNITPSPSNLHLSNWSTTFSLLDVFNLSKDKYLPIEKQLQRLEGQLNILRSDLFQEKNTGNFQSISRKIENELDPLNEAIKRLPSSQEILDNIFLDVQNLQKEQDRLQEILNTDAKQPPLAQQINQYRINQLEKFKTASLYQLCLILMDERKFKRLEKRENSEKIEFASNDPLLEIKSELRLCFLNLYEKKNPFHEYSQEDYQQRLILLVNPTEDLSLENKPEFINWEATCNRLHKKTKNLNTNLFNEESLIVETLINLSSEEKDKIIKNLFPISDSSAIQHLLNNGWVEEGNKTSEILEHIHAALRMI